MRKQLAGTVLACAVLLGLSGVVKASSFYASPTGTSSGDGSITRPWDLATAFNSKDHSLGGPIKPGDVLYLRGGRYQSPGPYVWWPTLTGAAGNPIVVRSYPGDPRPALDLMSYSDSLFFDNPARVGNPGKDVHNVDFYDIEIYSSTIVRSSSETGFNGMPNSFIIEGQNIRLIHCYIHDLGNFATFELASNNVVYGCITMDHGWIAPDRGHGHLMYIENDNSNGSVKTIQNNFGFTSYDDGVQEFGTAALTRAINFLNNTMANAGGARAVGQALIQWMIGQNDPTQIVADSNVFYTSPDLGSGEVEGGWQWDEQNGTIQFTNNYVIGPELDIGNWNTATVTGNHVFPRSANVSFYLYSMASPPQSFRNWTINSNVYGPATFVTGSRYLDVNGNPVTNSNTQPTPAQWQAAVSGDGNSTFNATGSQATLINPSTFIPGRVHITVWNPAANASVQVNLTRAGLTDGAAFEVLDAQNFGGPAILTGTYSAGAPTITLPAAGLVRKAMIGVGAQPEHTAPYLLTFVLLSGQALTGNWTPSGGDNVPPTVSITSPTAGQTVGGMFTVTATASDNVGVASVQFMLDGVNLGSPITTAPYQVSWNTTSSPNGAHTLTAFALDAASNRGNAAPVPVTVYNIPDHIPPTVSITSPISGQTVSNTISVSASASDNVGVVGVQFQLDGVNLGAEVLAAPYTISWDTTTASNASHILGAVARDAAGNRGSASVTVTVMNTVPTMPAPAAYWTLDSVDTVGGVALDKSGNGINLTVVNTTSVAGKVNQAMSFNGVNSALVASSRSTLDLHSSMTFAAWIKTSNSSRPETILSKYDTAGLESGYLFKTTAQGTLAFRVGGGNSTAGSQEVTDNVRVNDGGWHHAAVVVNLGLTATFFVDGVQTTSLPLPSTAGSSTVAFQAGNIAYPYYANPLTGSLDEVKVFTAALTPAQVASLMSGGDTTPPTVSITSPTAGQTVSGTITVTATASDNVGVTSVQFKLDNVNLGSLDTTSPYSVSWDTTTATNGTHSLTAVAMDAASNLGVSSAVTVTVNNTDHTPPTVSITSPTAGQTVSGTITVTATASDNVGVTSVQFKLDNVNLGPLDTTSPYSVSWDTTTATNGTHSLTAVARDAAGNPGVSTAVTVTVNNTDHTPPTVSITSPTAGQTVSGTIPVSASASDNVGVVGVQFQLDGANLGSEVLAPPYTISWNTTTASSSSHVLGAVARDAAGNRGNTSVTVTVQNNVPTVPPPVGYWTLDSADTVGGMALDKSGNGFNLTVTDTTSVTGKVNQAMSFNGYSSALSALSATELNLFTSMTFAAWIKTTNSTRPESIISKYDTSGTEAGYLFETTAQGTLGFQVGAANSKVGSTVVTDNVSINDGNWHHVAVVVNIGNTVTFFVDGVQTTSQPLATAPGNSTVTFEVGNIAYAYYASPLTGILDEVKVFNAALTAAQIGSLASGH